MPLRRQFQTSLHCVEFKIAPPSNFDAAVTSGSSYPLANLDKRMFSLDSGSGYHQVGMDPGAFGYSRYDWAEALYVF